MSNYRIAIVNTICTFTFWLIVALGLLSNWENSLLTILMVLVPISLLVFWRSYVLNKISASLKGYAFDGFKWGGISSSILFSISISSEVMAAGSPLMGASANDIIFYVFMFAVPITFVVGLIGMIHSVVYYFFSHWLNTAENVF